MPNMTFKVDPAKFTELSGRLTLLYAKVWLKLARLYVDRPPWDNPNLERERRTLLRRLEP